MDELLMNYKEVAALVPGDRVKVYSDGEYKKATVAGGASGTDPALWIAFDERQIANGNVITTKVFTGMIFEEDYWISQKFMKFSAEELAEELMAGEVG